MALTAAAHFAPKYDPSSDDEPDDCVCVCVLSVGLPFRYIIPSFDIIPNKMRQMVKGYTTDGEEHNYNIFIHNNPSLCRLYQVWMVIRDIEVRSA